MKRSILSLTALALLSALPAAAAEEKKPPTTDEKIEAAKTEGQARGDTAWMLVSTGMVLFMVPGLALFYGGMVRRKNVLGTMMHSMVCLGLIGIQWLLFGYSLAFGASHGGWFGWSPDFLGLQGVKPDATFPGTNIPIFLHCMYQGMFAIITPALISGAVAERIRFGPYCLFIVLWATIVYDPLAHWVWAVKEEPVLVDGKPAVLDGKEVPPVVKPAGFLGMQGALDFAGGTVVHIAAGFSGLAAILLLRKRRGYPEHAMHPNSMVLTLTGAGLLWFGWFGFNGGSALNSGPQAVSALTASQVAAAAAALSWMIVEWIHKGKPTALGLASGLVAGLVAVTPASGFVNPLGALAIGLAAGIICYGAVCLKPFFKYDDSLDAFGVHGVGGFLGAILTGVFFASPAYLKAIGFDADNFGRVNNGLATQLSAQFIAALLAAVYSFGVTLVLVFVIDKVWGFSLPAKEESEGLDRSEHGEVGFDLSPAMEMAPEAAPHEPRAALAPPNGKTHFTIAVEGADTGVLLNAWSQMCGADKTPPAPEFRVVYPYVTTVKGNRFRFRGGDPNSMRDHMRKLFEGTVGGKLNVRVEE